MWIMTADGWRPLAPRNCIPASKDDHASGWNNAKKVS